MKKIVLSLCCVLAMSTSSISLAHNFKNAYKGQAFAAGLAKVGKIGIEATDVIVINNTPDPIYVSAPGILRDYLPGNGVYRIISTATVSPEVILSNSNFGNFYDHFTQPHSIISFSVQNGAANTIAVEYY